MAKAVVEVIGAKKGERPFRTVVDSIGMGDGIVPYNGKAEELTNAIFNNMEMAHMLTVKT